MLPEIQAHGLCELWFQEDDAASHTARETMDLLKNHCGEHLNPRFSTLNWKPRSCNITPLDYFLWEYVKFEVFRNKPATIWTLWNLTLLVLFASYQSLSSNESPKIGHSEWTTSDVVVSNIYMISFSNSKCHKLGL